MFENAIVAGLAKAGLDFHPPPTACESTDDVSMLHHRQASAGAWPSLHQHLPAGQPPHAVPASATRRPHLVTSHRPPSLPVASPAPCRPPATSRRLRALPASGQLSPSPPVTPPVADRRARAWPSPLSSFPVASFPTSSLVVAVVDTPGRRVLVTCDGRVPSQSASHQPLLAVPVAAATTVSPPPTTVPPSYPDVCHRRRRPAPWAGRAYVERSPTFTVLAIARLCWRPLRRRRRLS